MSCTHNRSLTTLLDGAARIGATLSGELLNAVFANIGQRAIRRVARETFEHLLNLDLKFHLTKQTGGLTRAIDRGTKWVDNHIIQWIIYNVYHRGITFIMQAVIFRIVPTALEISLVCGILVCGQSSKEILQNLWYLVCARRTNLAGILLPSLPGHSLLTRGSQFAQPHGGMIFVIFTK